MSAEVVLILGPGAQQLAATLGTDAGSQWRFVPYDSLPAELPAEPLSAVLLTQKELHADPLVQKIAKMEPVSRRPGILTVNDVDTTKPQECSSALAQAIEKSWIRHSLAQFHELGGATFTAEMMELFQNQTEQYLNELQSSLSKGDATTVRRIVHTLKSTFANYGGRRLQTIAQMLENEAASGNLTVVQNHSSDFAAGVQRFREVLQTTAAEFSSEPFAR